jgi:hypothetical protein
MHTAECLLRLALSAPCNDAVSMVEVAQLLNALKGQLGRSPLFIVKRNRGLFMKKTKTAGKYSTANNLRAITIVAAYGVAFIFGAIVPFIAHADQDPGQNNSQNSHFDQGNNGQGDNNNNNDNGDGGDKQDNEGGSDHHSDNNGHDQGDGDDHHSHGGNDGNNGGDDNGDDGNGGNGGGDNTPQNGVLEIVKKTDVGDGTFNFIGSTGVGNFQMNTINGSSTKDFTLPVGTYTVTEDLTGNTLWVLSNTSINCSSVSVTAGATTTCEFDNKAVPQIGSVAVIKNTIGGEGTFSFSGVRKFTLTTINGTKEQDLYNIPVGSYSLTEAAQDGWTLTSNSCSDGLTVSANATTTCIVVNTKNPVTPPSGGGDTTPTNTSDAQNSGGGGNGPIAGSLGGGGTGSIFGGLVLGASTSTSSGLPNDCSALLHSYLRIGKNNDEGDVKRLQQFLNTELDANLTVNGVFGESTDAAVRKFQKAHQEQILAPWGIDYPTGYVYKTTERWINLTSCASLDIPMPELN